MSLYTSEFLNVVL